MAILPLLINIDSKNLCLVSTVGHRRRDAINRVGLAIYKNPSNNLCYEKRKQSIPPLCQESDDPNAAWNIPLQSCMHNSPVDIAVRGSLWPEEWPQRLEKTPYWLNSSQISVYGKPAPEYLVVSSSEEQSANNCNLVLHADPDACQENIGIKNVNWVCGAFGGDPGIKSQVLWLAASQISSCSLSIKSRTHDQMPYSLFGEDGHQNYFFWWKSSKC